MVYELHITRSTDWSENIGQEIPEDEWLALIAEDPELVPDTKNGPYSVTWSSTWFDWSDGNIFTADPNRATVAKMLALAGRLSGVVQGDDGEFYETSRDWPKAEPKTT